MNNNVSKEDMDFIQGIFRKAEYLEYLKMEEEIVIKNRRKMKIRTRKMVIALIITVILTMILVKVTNSNFGVLLVMSICVLALGCFYEYRREGLQYEH